jgi:hypothetical protein
MEWVQSINAQVFKNCEGTTLYFGGSKAEAKQKLKESYATGLSLK